MESSKTRLFLASVVLSAATAAICARSPEHPFVMPLDDRTLASVRGADYQYFKKVSASCQGNGVMALQQVTGNTYVPASGCGVANIGFNCGACEVANSSNVGLNGVVVDPGTGQMNDDVGACGNATAGTCGVTNPGGYPPNYACLGMAVFINPNTGLPVQCSDLIGIVNQGT